MFVVHVGHKSILGWDKSPAELTAVAVIIMCLVNVPVQFIPFNVDIQPRSANLAYLVLFDFRVLEALKFYLNIKVG